MDLTYKELAKRDVINVADGRCLGKIVDASFSFPQGVLTGIFVPLKRNGFLSFLNKSNLFISVNKIIRIGGDVILVDIKCGDNCLPSTTVDNKQTDQNKPKKPCPPPCGACSPCPPNHCAPCPSPCTPPCPPSPCNPCTSNNSCSNTIDLSGLFDGDGRLDIDDY